MSTEIKNAERKKVVTPIFRVSFPAVFKPEGMDGSEPKYGVTMLFDSEADLTELKQIARAAVKEKWGDKPPANMRTPFRDGAEKPDLDGYAGCVFVAARSKRRPGVVDENVQPIIDESQFYAGCYARASVTAYTYDKSGNKGVSFSLVNVQKIKDGEPFSSTSNPEDDFGPASESSVDESAMDDRLGF